MPSSSLQGLECTIPQDNCFLFPWLCNCCLVALRHHCLMIGFREFVYNISVHGLSMKVSEHGFKVAEHLINNNALLKELYFFNVYFSMLNIQI